MNHHSIQTSHHSETTKLKLETVNRPHQVRMDDRARAYASRKCQLAFVLYRWKNIYTELYW